MIKHINPKESILDALMNYRDPITGLSLDSNFPISLKVAELSNGNIKGILVVLNDQPRKEVIDYVHNIKLFPSNFVHLGLRCSSTL